MATGKFVAYYRVSTERQGASGLGLDAQREAVASFLNGGDWSLTAEFVEVESGKSAANRPELARALRIVKNTGATLIVAKLDRLSRDPDFLGALMAAGVDFKAVDNPHANKLTVRILAAVAEDERERTSQRTKAALQAAKARGVKLGNPNGAAALRRAGKGNAAGVAALKAKAMASTVDLMPIIEDVRAGGAVTLRQIADELNARGIVTASGRGKWFAAAVAKVISRAAG